MKNIDKIKKMNSEELAKEISKESDDPCSHCIYYNQPCRGMTCNEGIKKWLESEAEDE